MILINGLLNTQPVCNTHTDIKNTANLLPLFFFLHHSKINLIILQPTLNEWSMHFLEAWTFIQADMWQCMALWNQSLVISIFFLSSCAARWGETGRGRLCWHTDGEHYVCMMWLLLLLLLCAAHTLVVIVALRAYIQMIGYWKIFATWVMAARKQKNGPLKIYIFLIISYINICIDILWRRKITFFRVTYML